MRPPLSCLELLPFEYPESPKAAPALRPALSCPTAIRSIRFQRGAVILTSFGWFLVLILWFILTLRFFILALAIAALAAVIAEYLLDHKNGPVKTMLLGLGGATAG